MAPAMPAVREGGALAGRVMEEDFQRKRNEMHRVAKDCIVVVDNVPRIGAEKYERLLAKLTQVFSKFARMRESEDGKPRMNLVCNSDGGTVGFVFAEFVSPEEADKALQALHNLQFDRSHLFWACTAGNLERLQNVSDKFVAPEAPEDVEIRPNFKSWLLDERGRDQFMIRHGDTTSVFWHDHVVAPQMDYSRVMWTEGGSVWSPKGTYLASFHPQGIKLWGRDEDGNVGGEDGVEWVFVMRFCTQ